MATLLLTVAGGVLGGPVGAALGGLAGQAIDRNLLFKPKGREGPRLTDLAVQTSSYGTPIPRLFGTLRVAGSVIWSTDLIESRSKSSGGKGQPSLTSYSYSASFAVALSSRPIIGVGRIWADGKLLRGAAGDFKSQTGFRVYPGGEDQPVDPLIASVEGVSLSPAHRGVAYALFENFQLADYGNRIPSLTFEVIADGPVVPISVIAQDVGEGLVDADGVAETLGGFSAYGDSARDVLDVLASAADAWFSPIGGRLAMRNDPAPVDMVQDDGFADARGRGARSTRRTRSVAAIESVPQSITVAHYDPARDYQSGVQMARRPGAGTRRTRIDLPASLDASSAKAIATAALATSEAARERRSVALGWSAIDIDPGAPIAILGETGHWRVDGWSLEAMVLTLDLVRLADRIAQRPPASAGRVLSSPDRRLGQTVIEVFELPSLDDTLVAAPRLSIAAAGTEPGWRQAALLLSTNGGGSFDCIGATAAPATMGSVAVPPGAASAGLIDRVGVTDVDLLHADMTLPSTDDIGLDGGANLALIGDELVQFSRALPLGPTRWRLSGLLRGRRGTEAAIGRQQVGDRFVLLVGDAVATVSLPLSMLGSQAIILASGVGDTDPARREVFVSGASVLPPSPAQLTARRGTSGQITLSWARRSRLGWRWLDGVDAPLAEEREHYRVAVSPTQAPMASFACDTPTLTLSPDQAPVGALVAVRQVGTAGESPPAMLIIDI